jgi:ribonuclease T1
MRAVTAALVLVLATAGFAAVAQREAAPGPAAREIAVADLPKEARETLALIKKGGPYPYAKDGTVFGNREGRLPKQRRGYYREFTVRTPRERTRGARRIIAGERADYWYTDDHYATFRRIRE